MRLYFVFRTLANSRSSWPGWPIHCTDVLSCRELEDKIMKTEYRIEAERAFIRFNKDNFSERGIGSGVPY